MEINQEYEKHTIRSLEKVIKELEQKKPTPEIEVRIKNGEQYIHKLLDYHKDRALELEENNDRYIIMYESTNNYYKLIGVSALVYSQEIAIAIGKGKPKLREDKDTYHRQKDKMVCSIYIGDGTFDKLFRDFSQVGYEKNQEKSKDFLLVFQREQPYSQQHLITLENNATHDRIEHFQTVNPENPLPNLYLEIETLIRSIKSPTEQAFKNNRANYDAFIKGFYTNCHKLNKLYKFYAFKWRDQEEVLAEMLMLTRENKSTVSSFDETKAIPIKKLLKVFGCLEQIEKDICAELSRREKQRAKAAKKITPPVASASDATGGESASLPEVVISRTPLAEPTAPTPSLSSVPKPNSSSIPAEDSNSKSASKSKVSTSSARKAKSGFKFQSRLPREPENPVSRLGTNSASSQPDWQKLRRK